MQETFDKYFPVVMGDKERPYLVLFDALIGYGKSYVARRLADIDGSIIICNNQVRYRLNDYDDQHAQEWHELQHQRIKALLANGNSLIIDECLPINYQKKQSLCLEAVKIFSSQGCPQLVFGFKGNPPKLLTRRGNCVESHPVIPPHVRVFGRCSGAGC